MAFSTWGSVDAVGTQAQHQLGAVHFTFGRRLVRHLRRPELFWGEGRRRSAEFALQPTQGLPVSHVDM